MEKIIYLYKFIYSDCTWESAPQTISIHKTKKGAYKAMRNMLLQNYTEWYNNRNMTGKKWYNKFGEMEYYGICKTELKE